MTDLTPETVNKTLAKFLWPDTGEPVHMAFTRSLDMCRMVERKLYEDHGFSEWTRAVVRIWDMERCGESEESWICKDPELVARALAETIVEAGLVEL